MLRRYAVTYGLAVVRKLIRLALTTLGVLGSIALVAACNSNDAGSGLALGMNERKGAVDGVGLGDRAEKVERVFGAAPPYNIYKNSTPIGVDPPDLTLAAQGGCKPRGRENALRYEGVSFFAYANEVCDVLVTSRGAATLRGLSPGDSIDRVEELYSELACGKTNVSSDGTFFEPACWGRIGPKSYMWVGGDPINNILFVNRPIRPRR